MFRNCCQRQNSCCQRQNECGCMQPIIEPVVTNCVEKEYFHEVEHIIPMHTHVVNKHIYNHVYRPQFSCSEECQMMNNECSGNLMNR